MTIDDTNDDRTRSFVPLTKGTMVSHYRIVEKIGAGGMGEVYLAEDTKLKRKVALKFLPTQLSDDADFKARFVREAEATAKLNHPNIITIHEVAEYQGRPFFAMELVEGQSLRELSKGKELGIDRIIELAVQVCDGLGAAHDKQVVHRDIKPSNIVIDAYGRPKILDFGLAAIQGGEHLTKTGSTLGTVRYMSPEQVQGQEVDHRSDLFSLGVVLYELIAGRTPFERDNEAATLKAIAQDNPEPLARYKFDVPDEVERIIGKLLEKDTSLRYQTASGVSSDLKRLLTPTQSSIVASPTRKTSSRLTRILVPSFVVIVAVAVLVLKPWRFEISPGQEVIAAENRIAIMYFDNLADPADSQKLGEIAANLLITDLTESQYLDVVSSQRLYDILKLLGREGEKEIGRDVATQVAKKARARWMLLGSILQVEPQLIVTSQLVDVESGAATASQRVTGEEDENIFAVVDKLTVEVKNDMSLPAQAQTELDRPIAEVTTNSPEAYRYYLEGVDLFWRYDPEATTSLRKALEFDSTMAMAYFWIAWDIATPGGIYDPALPGLAAQAAMYSDNVSRLEKRYIDALQALATKDYTQFVEELTSLIERYPDEKLAYYWLAQVYLIDLGKSEKAITYYYKVLEIDSLYKTAYNYLAYAYNGIDEIEKSTWAINKYISIAPNEPNPYDTRGDLFAINGRLDEAIESYRKALELKPDYHWSLGKLGDVYLRKGEYAEAGNCYQELLTSDMDGGPSWGRTGLARIPAYQGKFNEALEVLDDAIAADKMGRQQGYYKEQWRSYKHYLKAHILREKGELTQALEEIKEATRIIQEADSLDVLGYRGHYIALLAMNNEIGKAEQEARNLRRDIEENDSSMIWAYWRALGNLELARGNPHLAVSCFEKVYKAYSSWEVGPMFELGQAYLASGRLGEAVTVLERVLKRSFWMGWSIRVNDAARANYLLGVAYEESGWNNKAIEQYETFLDIWKNADSGFVEIEDAKARLAKLKNE